MQHDYLITEEFEKSFVLQAIPNGLLGMDFFNIIINGRWVGDDSKHHDSGWPRKFGGIISRSTPALSSW